ncbi:MAG TPA: transcription antitermination factor NusB [Pseudonocardia sp.]|jgi:N utilization substance protein B|nr:transcription antitermination factor NusB [Pseudonocardia sp.]
MRARTRARKRALDVLFESEARQEDPLRVLEQRRAHADAPPVSDYAAMLVEGVSEHRERIDQILSEHSEGWSVPRMPAVDRTVLRIGLYELLWVEEIDDPVAITEAVELARALSTDDSPRFVNGVLGRISDIAAYLRPGLRPAPAVAVPAADDDADVVVEADDSAGAAQSEPIMIEPGTENADA